MSRYAASHHTQTLVKQRQNIGGLTAFEWTRMVAIICGVRRESGRRRSCGSIKVERVSIPLVVMRVSRISSSRLEAFFSPSALTSTERRYSLALIFSAANCSASAQTLIVRPSVACWRSDAR
ncbi:hypothetical protein KCP69_18155 [Salmonella enterica subsp. enterica]|nr:hypothetical protein KCP69_18155 [Salmonella enterica subsp. enterica]